MTTLQVNGSAAAATTLAAAGKMFNATGGTSGNTSTKVGSGTLFKQIFAKGTTTGQTGVSSIPAPTDSNFNGWMWDVLTLEGQNILAGTWTPTFHLLASTGTTVTPTVQWYKRSSGGVYTSIGSVAGSSIALTTSSQALTFTPPSLSAMAFATGDKLVMWLWVNQTAGGATNSTISVVEATSGSSAGVTSEAQAATPGYLPSKVTDSTGVRTRVRTASTKPYAATVLADSPIRYYRLGEASGTTAIDLGSQAQNGTLNGTITENQAAIIKDFDGSMLFNGSTGYISFPTTSLPTGASAMTLECWVELASVPGAGVYGTALNIGTGVTKEDWSLYYGDPSGNLSAATLGTQVGSGHAISINTPYHCVLTFDGATAIFYVNGVQQGSSTAVASMNVTYGVGYIGQDAGGGFFFNGTIDEVAIYSVALTPAQVSAHYTAGTTASDYTRIRVPIRTQVTKSLGLRIVTSTSTLVTKVASLRTLIRTQKTASAVVRTLVRTQKTLSTGIRAVVKGVTKVASVRVPVRTQQTKSTALRTAIRTQITKSTPVRALVRTLHSLSSPLRTLVRTLKTVSAPIRARIRTQRTLTANLRALVRSRITQSTALRTIVRGITKVVSLRTKVRSQRTLTSALRTMVTTGVNLATKSAVLRTLVRTLKSVSTNLRVKVRSQVSKYSIIRTVVRSLHNLSTQLRVRVRSQVVRTAPLRAVIRGVTRLSTLRAHVSTKASAVTVLRVYLVNLSTGVCTLRTPVRSAKSQSACIRVIVLIPPNAVVFVRSGDAQSLVRSGDASAQVRSGDATLDVRSGDTSVQVRSGDAAVKVKD